MFTYIKEEIHCWDAKGYIERTVAQVNGAHQDRKVRDVIASDRLSCNLPPFTQEKQKSNQYSLVYSGSSHNHHHQVSCLELIRPGAFSNIVPITKHMDKLQNW